MVRKELVVVRMVRRSSVGREERDLVSISRGGGVRLEFLWVVPAGIFIVGSGEAKGGGCAAGWWALVPSGYGDR